MSRLLPSRVSDFHLREFWSDFFDECGARAFEWYGEWSQLRGLVISCIGREDGVLVVGCGNSDLSGQMYDDGFHRLTNVDYTESVIDSMRELHRQRSEMVFECMDVTQMRFSAASFDVVLDKACLDAVLSDESAEVLTSAGRMLSEVQRVLRPKGRYLCVSLLQEHILRKLLTDLHGWSCELSLVPVNLEESSLCPFLLVFRRPAEGSEALWTATFHEEAGFDYRPPVAPFAPEDLPSHVERTQYLYRQRQELLRPKHGLRYETDLSLEKDATPRFHVMVLDEYSSAEEPGMAVFIVPQGMEGHHAFRGVGLQDVLKQSEADRLLVVSLHREYSYTSLEELQRDLDPLVQPFIFVKCKRPIPYLMPADSLGHRNVIHEGESALSGRVFIEQSTSDGHEYRQLFFQSNPLAVQSEACLKQAKGKGKAKSRGKGKAKPKLKAATGQGASGEEFDHGYLSFDIHKLFCASPAFLPSLLLRSDGAIRVLLIGLGGGSLPMYLSKAFAALSVDVIELDPLVVSLAKRFFGFAESERVRVLTADGLQYPSQPLRRDYDLVMIDVDNKRIDPDKPVSFPPEAFLQIEYLESLKALVVPTGAIAINLGSPNAELVEARKAALRPIFTEMCSIATGDVNHLLLGFLSQVPKSVRNASPEMLAERLAKTARGHKYIARYDFASLLENVAF